MSDHEHQPKPAGDLSSVDRLVGCHAVSYGMRRVLKEMSTAGAHCIYHREQYPRWFYLTDAGDEVRINPTTAYGLVRRGIAESLGDGRYVLSPNAEVKGGGA